MRNPDFLRASSLRMRLRCLVWAISVALTSVSSKSTSVSSKSDLGFGLPPFFDGPWVCRVIEPQVLVMSSWFLLVDEARGLTLPMAVGL